MSDISDYLAEDAEADAEERETRYRGELGLRIREAREARGLTKTGLAAEAGLSQGAVGKLERGEFRASQRVLESMARALSVGLDWLVSGEGERDLQADTVENTDLGQIYRAIGRAQVSMATMTPEQREAVQDLVSSLTRVITKKHRK